MSRYPFRECVNKVMEAYTGNRAQSTLEVMGRRYNRMEKEITALYRDGQLSTTAPKNLTPTDIERYYTFLRSKTVGDKPIEIRSIKKDLIDLDKLCKFDGNNCIDVFRHRCPALSRPDSRERYSTFSKSECEEIIEYAAAVEPGDFRRIRAYGLLGLYFGAGLRTVEAVNVEAENIHLDDDAAYVHLTVVKGQDTYGHHRDALIIPCFVPMIRRYMTARRRYLDGFSRDSKYVFFGMDGFNKLSDKTIRQIRNIAEQDLGLRFDGRKCRRSYGQYLKDHDIDIETVSSFMGHSTTKTTEQYYARISPELAMEKARRKLV